MSQRRVLVTFALVGAAGPLCAQGAGAPAIRRDGLQVAAPATVGLRAAPLLALNQAAVDDSFPNTTSVLVLKDGRLAFERYFRGGGPEVLNDTRSAMKSVTALAVGAALDDGALRSVDESAFRRLADRAPFKHDGPVKQGITLADFLTMSSPLDCNDWDAASPGNEENMYPLRDWTRWAVDIPVKTGYTRDEAGRGPFSYCTAGVFLLGQVLQRALGEPVDRYVNRRLLDPLGIARRAWSRSPSGEVMTGGGLRLRSRDLAKLGLLVSAGGRWRDRQVVPPDWIARMLTTRNTTDSEQRYGFLYWQREYRTPCGRAEGWYMSGNGGNVVMHVPSLALVAVVTRRHYNQRGMHQQTVRLLEDHVLAALTCRR
jgi:CubicO group peptidase (beta-lactamase class C family)